VIGGAVGATILVPSLILLFSLFVRGRLDTGVGGGPPILDVPSTATDLRRPQLVAAFLLACLSVGAPLTTLAQSGWARAVGIACLCAFAASAFVLAATIHDEQPDERVDVHRPTSRLKPSSSARGRRRLP